MDDDSCVGRLPDWIVCVLYVICGYVYVCEDGCVRYVSVCVCVGVCCMRFERTFSRFFGILDCH